MPTPNNDDRDKQPAENQPNQKRRPASQEDIHDSERDTERLKPETASIDLPDVEDIPGQEHFHVLPLGEMGDTTISSDDEEGKSVFGED